MLTYTTTHEVPNEEHPVPGLPGWHVHIIYDDDPENPQDAMDTVGVIEDTDRAQAERLDFDPQQYADWLREKHGATVVRALNVSHGSSQPHAEVWDPMPRSTDYVSAWQYDTPEGRSVFWRDGDGNDDWIVGMLEHELQVYQQWVTGEVYGYILHDPDDEDRGSCFGFYGENGREHALDAAMDEAAGEELYDREKEATK